MLARRFNDLFEPSGFDLGFGQVVKLGQRTASPERDRITEQPNRPVRIGTDQAARRLDRILELNGIGRCIQSVPGWGVRDHQPGGAQAEHVSGDGVARGCGRLIAPSSSLQFFPRHGPAATERQPGQYTTLPATAKPNLRRPVPNLNWTEDADKHGAILRGFLRVFSRILQSQPLLVATFRLLRLSARP